MNDHRRPLLPSELCWRPEDQPEDELGFFVGLFNALGMLSFLVIMIWCGIAWFSPDEFNPPLEIGEAAP